MKLLIFLGVVGLIHGVPLSFNINGGLTGKPFPITRGFLGGAKKTVDAISRPIENAQFSLSGNVGESSQADSVRHQYEQSYSSSNLNSDLATSSQNSASFSLSKSESLGSNIDSSTQQIERSFSSGSQRNLNSARRESSSLSRSGSLSSNFDSSSEHNLRSTSSNVRGQSSLGTSLSRRTEGASLSHSKSTSLDSNIDSSSHQIESGFGSVSSNLGGQATLGANLVSQGEGASLSLSRSGSLGTNVVSSSHQIESGFGSVSSNLEGQSTLGANLISQGEGASLSLSRSGNLDSNVVSSSHQIESGSGAVSSNLAEQASLDSSLLSQADGASFSRSGILGSNFDSSSHKIESGFQAVSSNVRGQANSDASLSLSRSGSLDSTIDSSNHDIRNNLRSSSSNIGGIQEHFETGLAKTNSHYQASNILKSASALNVDSSAQHQIESSLSAQGVGSSISEESVENYPIGYSKSHNFGSDSLIESDETRSYDERVDLEELLRRQNANAHYTFSTDIKDNINDLTQERAEVRDGLNVRGHYSYSDGNIRYIVHYVADENGYRVEKQETIKLEGPKVNPLGTAEIDAINNDVKIHYGVRSIPINNGTLIIRK